MLQRLPCFMECIAQHVDEVGVNLTDSMGQASRIKHRRCFRRPNSILLATLTGRRLAQAVQCNEYLCTCWGDVQICCIAPYSKPYLCMTWAARLAGYAHIEMHIKTRLSSCTVTPLNPTALRCRTRAARLSGRTRHAAAVRAQSSSDAMTLLLDCDGVLADTEAEGHRVSFNNAFKQKGLLLSYRPASSCAAGEFAARHHTPVCCRLGLSVDCGRVRASVGHWWGQGKDDTLLLCTYSVVYLLLQKPNHKWMAIHCFVCHCRPMLTRSHLSACR